MNEKWKYKCRFSPKSKRSGSSVCLVEQSGGFVWILPDSQFLWKYLSNFSIELFPTIRNFHSFLYIHYFGAGWYFSIWIQAVYKNCFFDLSFPPVWIWVQKNSSIPVDFVIWFSCMFRDSFHCLSFCMLKHIGAGIALSWIAVGFHQCHSDRMIHSQCNE